MTHEMSERGALQRKCGCGGSCGACGSKRKRHELSRSARGNGSVTSVPASVHEVLRSPGHPLQDGTRALMESRFRHTFSGVRVHTDPQAAQSAADVDARAFTVGSHIVFGPGAWSPGTTHGRSLLAHELTHVVQQGNAPAPARESLSIGEAGSAAEREADRNESAIATGAPLSTAHSSGASIARQPISDPPAAPAQSAAPTTVELVRISCTSRQIEFVTNAGSYIYPITSCDIPTPLDYQATVRIIRGFVAFSDPPQPGSRMRFVFRIRRGEPNPSTFFGPGGQTTVHVVTGDVVAQPQTGGGGATTGEDGGGTAETQTDGAGETPGPGWSGPVVCSRPLDVRGLGYFKHAFIHDDPYNYAIRFLHWGNGITTSCSDKYDNSPPPDDPATSVCKRCNPAPGQGVGDVSACLRRVYNGYASPNLYRNLPDPSDGWAWGPNSNSFAAAMATCCHDFNPSGLGSLPGWNHRPAGPCPPRPEDDEGVGEEPREGGPDEGRELPDAGVPYPGGVPAAACNPVVPGGAPNVTNPAPNNTCTPAQGALTWDVVDADPANWGVCVSAYNLAGQINIKPWPSQPNTMTTPNTANPVDGGNIQNSAGSRNHWQFAIDDMADYDSAAGGGAGPHWHATAASEAHEWAHWNQDWIGDSITASGGNWPNANTDLNALREPKNSSPTPAGARTALQPRVNARFNTFWRDSVTRWNTIINGTDKPGGGGNGYAAGMRVLNGLISAVRAYAASKGW